MKESDKTAFLMAFECDHTEHEYSVLYFKNGMNKYYYKVCELTRNKAYEDNWYSFVYHTGIHYGHNVTHTSHPTREEAINWCADHWMKNQNAQTE